MVTIPIPEKINIITLYGHTTFKQFDFQKKTPIFCIFICTWTFGQTFEMSNF
jgi:hypothetical protein